MSEYGVPEVPDAGEGPSGDDARHVHREPRRRSASARRRRPGAAAGVTACSNLLATLILAAQHADAVMRRIEIVVRLR